MVLLAQTLQRTQFTHISQNSFSLRSLDFLIFGHPLLNTLIQRKTSIPIVFCVCFCAHTIVQIFFLLLLYSQITGNKIHWMVRIMQKWPQWPWKFKKRRNMPPVHNPIGFNNGNMQIEFYLCILAIVSVAIV